MEMQNWDEFNQMIILALFFNNGIFIYFDIFSHIGVT